MSPFFPWLSAGLLGALLFVSGCSKALDRASTEVVEQTYPIDPAARLKIRNLRGSISIHGADTQELKLRATKTIGSEAQLRDITISVAAETGSVSISTNILPQKRRSPSGGAGTVDYELVVPRTINIARLELEDGSVLIEGMEDEDVHANVVDGQVTIRKCCANIHVALANGDLDLSLPDCRQHSFLTDAQLTHGKARVSIPRGASFHARAQTMTGKILNDFADIVDVNGRSLQKIDISVGPDAGSQLVVRVTTGDIILAAVGPAVSGPQSASVAGSQ
ncbi:MAG: hypothetical protein WAO00_06430 [Chthoniobacterales bacterium]